MQNIHFQKNNKALTSGWKEGEDLIILIVKLFSCFTINILGNTEKTLVINNVFQWSMEVINGENNLIYFRNLNMHKLSKHTMIMKSCTV